MFHLPWTHLGIVWHRLTIHRLVTLRYHSSIQPARTFIEKAQRTSWTQIWFWEISQISLRRGDLGQNSYNVNSNGYWPFSLPESDFMVHSHLEGLRACPWLPAVRCLWVTFTSKSENRGKGERPFLCRFNYGCAGIPFPLCLQVTHVFPGLYSLCLFPQNSWWAPAGLPGCTIFSFAHNSGFVYLLPQSCFVFSCPHWLLIILLFP